MLSSPGPSELPRTARTAATRLLVCGLLFAAAHGCREKARNDPQAPRGPTLAGIDVSVAAPPELGLERAWDLAVSEWQASTGATCTINPLHEGAADDPLSGLPPDTSLLIAPLPLWPELVDAHWLAPLPREENAGPQPLWQDLFGGLRRGFADPGGRPGLIPVDCPLLVCGYRADLLEAAGKAPPRTWQEYQELLDQLGEWAPGLTAVEPWSESFRATMFLARAVSAAHHPDNYSLYLDVSSGEPLVASAPFVESLREARLALAKLDPASRELGPGECFLELIEGRAALAIGYPPPPAFDSTTAVRPDEVRLGISALPGSHRVFERQTGDWIAPPEGSRSHRVTLVGFDGYAVCVTSKTDERTQQAAWQFWRAIDSPDSGVPSSDWARRVCRKSNVDAIADSPAPPLRSTEWRDYVKVSADALETTRVVADLPLPHRAQFRAPLTMRLAQAMTGEASPEECLAAVADDWNALIEQLGRRRVVNTYRACSGLSPLPPE